MKRGQGGLWLGVLVAVVAVGGVGWLLYHDLLGETPSTPAPTASPSPAPDAGPARSATVASGIGGRSDTILTCEAENGRVFYTNATRCEDADLDNRVNVLPAFETPRPVRDDCLGAQSETPRAHQFLAVCQESFNEALTLEPRLLESADPAASRAGRRYCALITEGVQAGCMATSDQFCFLSICQEIRESEGS